jgi:lysophospholipase L1-like esterase
MTMDDMTATEQPPRGRLRLGRPGPGRPRLVRPLLAAAGMLLTAVLAVGAALEVTPMQTVTVAGQVISVGAALRPSLSGPGEVDLFGQSLATAVSFPGPVRPRLELTQITLNSELADFVKGGTPSEVAATLRMALVSGWEHYFGWEAAAAGLAALILAGALAGWRRLPGRSTAWILAAALVTTELINGGAVALTARGAQDALRHVHSLNQLVASAPIPALPNGRPRLAVRGVQEVVLGDSTAAGAGLAPVGHPSAADRGCGRSSESYGQDLAAANGWRTVNLACDSATIRAGLLGPQQRSGIQIPAQITAASQFRNPSVVIVSVGADDLQWSTIVATCAVESHCDNGAAAAFFQQKLADFSTTYLQLLIQLGSLPGHPKVIINQYYDPFGSDTACIVSQGLTAAKIPTLNAWLTALNQVLAKGAAQSGFLSAQPSFAGHQLCSPQPYVQGLGAAAPFHPTALGQLAIALADQAALAQQPPSGIPASSGSPLR